MLELGVGTGRWLVESPTVAIPDQQRVGSVELCVETGAQAFPVSYAKLASVGLC